MTAAASQIGRMIIKLCKAANVVPICTVRREEQAEFLRKEFNVPVVNMTTNHADLAKICAKEKPMACLECIAGDTTGEMLSYIGFGSTLILYGLLSDKPAGNINVI